MQVLLIKDFNTDSLKFKKSRKTASNSVIIDIEEMPLLQSPWCKIVYPVEHTINVEATDIFLQKTQDLDNIIVNHCSKVFDFCPQDMTEMYKSMIKCITKDDFESNRYIFRVSMNTTTVIYSESNEYSKKDANEILKVGDIIRFLFKIKKITMSNHEIKIQIDLAQVEKYEASLDAQEASLDAQEASLDAR